MIDIILKESEQTTDLSTRTTAPITIEERIDTSLDGGTLTYLRTERDDKGLNEALAGYSVKIAGETFEFVGMDSRALLRREENGQSIYKHQVSLTEPSKLLQGVLIDGFGVTRPEDVIASSGTRTVSQNSAIQTIASGSRYIHRAEGVITVTAADDDFTEIASVEGSIANTTPTAYYDEETGEIAWSVQWYDGVSDYTQPYTVTVTYTYNYAPNASTLEDVVERLLAVNPLDTPIFTLTTATAVRAALKSIIAPEFKWNTQTTLWECLLQIGAVIDAIPRLTADDNGNYTVVTFDFVNAYVNEVDKISDLWTNAEGESVDESQYNTRLRSTVENLRENE